MAFINFCIATAVSASNLLNLYNIIQMRKTNRRELWVSCKKRILMKSCSSFINICCKLQSINTLVIIAAIQICFQNSDDVATYLKSKSSHVSHMNHIRILNYLHNLKQQNLIWLEDMNLVKVVILIFFEYIIALMQGLSFYHFTIMF